MGNRPINRRPFRRKPWAKKVRPTRWNAVTGSAAYDNGLTLNTAVLPGGADGNPPTHILVDGQVDVEPWADDQEVTLDRIVGFFHFTIYQSGAERGAFGMPSPVLLKCGIVLNEELSSDPASNVVSRNLWDQEDLEDAEWVWLYSQAVYPNALVVSVDESYRGMTTLSIPVDIRNRRKIGQSDELAFYSSFENFEPQWSTTIQAYADVRCILMSR